MKISSLYLTILTIVLSTFQVFSQSFSVPSPSASQMTKYGGASLNESTGQVTTSIPIYNYKVGNLSLPMGLTYIGNGVKIDQHSNWVGTNWLLSSGGVVTRVVNHLPDETAQNRLFTDDVNALFNSSGEPNDITYVQDLIDGVNTTDDLRPDNFSFSFPGYSGSFYLDKTNQPRLMNANTELKIEMIGGVIDPTILNTIKITTPSGVSYYFGGDDASESSSTMVNMLKDTQGTLNFDVMPKAITAFYLYKIEHPFGSEMYLEYHDDGDKEYVMFQGDEMTKLEAEFLEYISETCEDELGINETNDVTKSLYKGKIYNRKKISRIYSSDSDVEIRFNSAPFFIDSVTNDPQFYTPQYDDRVLNSIQVYNTKIAKNVKQVKLNYLTTDYRIFLEEVITNNDNDPSSTSKCSSYKMEYDNPQGLPERFSKAQDLLGYYNGENGNTNYLPQTTEVEFEGAFANLSNRSVNFQAAKKGSLTRIENPSGGATTFDYEAPQVKALTTQRLFLNTYRNQSNLIPVTESVATAYLGDPLPQPGFPVQHVPVTQEVTLIINVEVDPSTGNVDHHDKIFITLHNNTTGQDVNTQMALSNGQISYHRNFNFNIEEGNAYTLTTTLDPQNPGPAEASFVMNAYLDYTNYKQFDAYGIRVKRINTIAETGAQPIKKTYYYKRAKNALSTDEDEVSAVITYDPTKTYRNNKSQPCCPTTYGSSVYSYISLVSNPFSYYYASADNQVSYRYVTISLGGDIFEQGGIEKQFRIETVDEPTILMNAFNSYNNPQQTPTSTDYWNDYLFLGNYSDNNTIFNGAPQSVTHIKNDGGVLYKVKESKYDYNLSVLDQTEGMILTPNTKACVSLAGNTLYSVSTAYYNNFSYDYDLTQSRTIEYLDKLPRVDGGGNSPAITEFLTVRDITYSDLKGMPKTITSTNSDGGQQIVKNYYLTPNDLDYLDGIGAITQDEMDTYNALITAHRIGAPIQVETYIKNEGQAEQLATKQKVVFSNYNGLLLQQTSLSSKFDGPLESYMTYHKYDTQGLPLEVSGIDGIKTSALYGYNDKKVIAELSNLAYDDIPIATINNLQTLANNVTNITSMDALESALNQLRTDFPEAKINTYVYNRLGQLSSMQDNRGYKVSYIYDACYRLVQVKDQDGNIVQENDYNIINNN